MVFRISTFYLARRPFIIQNTTASIFTAKLKLGVYIIFLWHTINLQRETQKANVSQLSSIVRSESANIRNNTMEMD